MSRPGPFGHPYCLGFDEVERLLERLARGQTDAYPPMNIEQPAEGRLSLTLAVAGFAPEQLTVTLQDRELVVKGARATPSEERTFLHKGIANRGFQRSFVLADGLEVEGAKLATAQDRFAPPPAIPRDSSDSDHFGVTPRWYSQSAG